MEKPKSCFAHDYHQAIFIVRKMFQVLPDDMVNEILLYLAYPTSPTYSILNLFQLAFLKQDKAGNVFHY
jgi:hypothetical protein